MIDIATETVSDFMKALLVTEPRFPTAEAWYFRGQRDAGDSCPQAVERSRGTVSAVRSH